MFPEWFEIFKSGKHIDNNNVVRSYTNTDLDTIVNNYNSQNDYEAPIIIGHDLKDTTPAWGYIEKLKRENNSLFAKPKQIVSEFAELVQKGIYKNRSISLEGNILKHVAFLGGAIPAVKGLEQINFSESKNTDTFNFNETTEGSFFMTEQEIKELQDKNSNLEKEVAKLSEANKTLKTDYDALSAEVKKSEVEKAAAEEANFCENLVKEGKMIPAEKESVISVLKTLRSTANFSEKDSSYSNFKKSLTERPVLANFSESAKKENAPGKTEEVTGQQAIINELKAQREKK